MPHAARLSDKHSCPLATPTPHVGGVIVGPGASSVVIEHLPAAVMGSTCACGPSSANITKTSQTVTLEYRGAARVGDMTSHGGIISSGCTTVLIGG